MFNRIEFKESAKDCLEKNWSYMAGLNVIIFLVTAMCGLLNIIPFIGFIISIFIGPCFAMSRIFMAMKLYRREHVIVGDIFSGFQFPLKCVGLSLWIGLWTTLWGLLFVIPGIVKGYSYSMAFYCLSENPDLTIRQALKESMRITKGYKFDLFVLELSFIGWGIACLFTCGIGLLFLEPYVTQTNYAAYRFLHEQDSKQGEPVENSYL